MVMYLYQQYVILGNYSIYLSFIISHFHFIHSFSFYYYFILLIIIYFIRPGGVEKFDQDLYNNLTIVAYADQPHTTSNDMWKVFQPIFSRVNMVYRYIPVFRKYFHSIFTKLFNDGIIRWEMRSSFDTLYDETGQFKSKFDTIQIILDELEKWKQEDYEKRSIFSLGLVTQGFRASEPSVIIDDLITAYQLRDKFPNHIVGFDLVGQEDPGETLLYWSPYLINITNTMPKPEMTFFFHAGESNQLNVQENLVDAVYLNTTRIGHGFGIPEFPGLWPLISQKGILIEANPISNQVLGLIKDQRNHPVGDMLRHSIHNVLSNKIADIIHSNSNFNSNFNSEINQYSPHWEQILELHPNLKHYLQNRIGLPSLAVSINNDDPGMWGIDAIVSFDWYVAVVAWNLSLAGIKQLAIDSIVHSGASIEEKGKLLLAWFKSWDEWIDTVANMQSNN